MRLAVHIPMAVVAVAEAPTSLPAAATAARAAAPSSHKAAARAAAIHSVHRTNSLLGLLSSPLTGCSAAAFSYIG